LSWYWYVMADRGCGYYMGLVQSAPVEPKGVPLWLFEEHERYGVAPCSQTRFSSPEIGESEKPTDPNVVFSLVTASRGKGLDLNRSYSSWTALRRGPIPLGVDFEFCLGQNVC
jgi:hypothetical protein